MHSNGLRTLESEGGWIIRYHCNSAIRVSDYQLRGPGYETTCYHLETWTISNKEPSQTLKVVGIFPVVHMPREVKDPTQGLGMPVSYIMTGTSCH